MATQVIERHRLSHAVYTRLERDILEGKIQPGEALPSERGLMEQFGVGRPSIREALAMLSRAGLVTVANGSRARASRPEPKNMLDGLASGVRMYLAEPEGVRHFQSARLLLECALARHAACNATAEHILVMQDALKRNENALGTGEFEATDVEFHLAIAKVTENPLFVALHGAVANWLKEQRATVLRTAGQDLAAYNHHASILRAITAQDADGAETSMRTHIEQVINEYWKSKERLRKGRRLVRKGG